MNRAGGGAESHTANPPASRRYWKHSIDIFSVTLKPQKVTLDDNRAMTVKEAVFALAPTLERMKKRGFDLPELVEKLHEKGVPVKVPTLAKYLNEFMRGKEKKVDTPRQPVA